MADKREAMRVAAYSVSELANRWNCSRSVIYGAIRRGELKAFRASAHAIRITASEVARHEETAPFSYLEK